MKIGNLDTRDKVMIVAEIGNSHEGSVELGRQLVDKAADAGVDAVKFQTFKTYLPFPLFSSMGFLRFEGINEESFS